ncbi:TPA: acyltransferase family protein [Enterobacter roggenkampii]|uniref:acyltransferase family protein n=1 Tax=Enterobacter roggenkampii TaxID=1812935 RepID=UPI0021127532|nr:acyltransferase family protein [Enterobacter roggenkampii]HDT2133835.1 acyltransferase [Enterobacter roggenkampii]
MKDKLISLNVLRGVAAMLVVLYHMEVLQVSFITRLFTWGWIGVDIFFVLSGLFIGISVIKSKPWDTLKYLKRRFLRIAPAYYFSMLVLVALASSYFLVTTNGITHIAVHLLFFTFI